MDLAHGERLWLLLLVPWLLAWGLRCRRRRAAEWSALGQGGWLRGDGGRGWLAAMTCLILALAGPRWGRVPAPPLGPGRDVVLLIDDSRSMAAEDAVPHRHGAAVEAAVSLVRALGRAPGNRAAVVAFAGRGVVRTPLTENLSAVIDTLHRLRPGDVHPGGTNLRAALNAALDVFGPASHTLEREGGRTIVIFSDGEDHAGSWTAAVEPLRGAGVVVHAVAVGDADAGHPVPGGPGQEVLTYQGTPVQSRRSDTALAGVARATGGVLVPLGLASADLGTLYLERIEPLVRQRREDFRITERGERFGWFLGAALVLGLSGSWPRRGWRAPRRRRLLFWASFAGLLCVVSGASPGPSAPANRDTPRSADAAVAAGRSAYARGDWPGALAAFDQAATLQPHAAVPLYNRSATLFQMGRFAEALEGYRTAREYAGAVLRTKIDYALGNTALALGDPAGAVAHYDACVASTAHGADVDAVRRDAAVNRRFAVESARRSATPPPGAGDENSSTPPTRRTPGAQGQGESPSNPSAEGPSEGNNRDDPGEAGAPRRGPGGAGGSGPAPSGEGSADDRLDQALRRIRETRRPRQGEIPPSAATGNLKDW